MDSTKSSDALNDMKMNAYLSDLLTLAMDESGHTEKGSVALKSDTVERVRDYIDQNYASEIVLDDLAERFRMNKEHLSKSFRKQLGLSISA